ncbi:MAG: alpha/beta hydrolase [Bdellovibrionaceae bacterium]|nr:alpha/beta hydrolase [Bdellovibrionales bacterium]MCB9083391.1 alpha/beta hydrolase [Pseudobdellovibrionaceae bacterium]
MKRILIVAVIVGVAYFVLQDLGVLGSAVRPPANLPANTRLVFLHGGPGFDDYMQEIFSEHFANYGIFYTQSKGPNIKVSHLVGELNQKIQPNSKTILVGHSWGGVLALEALRYPQIAQRVSGLVIISSPLLASQEAEFQRALAQLSEPSVANIFLSIAEKESWQPFLAKVMKTFDRELANRFRDSYLNKLNLAPVLSSLRIPVLHIYGSDDIRVPAAGQRAYTKFRPNLQVLEIPHGGHFPFLIDNHRAQVSQAIWDFVGQIK